MSQLSKEDELKLFTAFKTAFKKFFKTAKQKDVDEMFGAQAIEEQLK